MFPSYQFWEGVAGEPLRQLLRALGDQPSGQDATFFSAVNPDLIGSTPVEVLIGERLTTRDEPPEALVLLNLDPGLRLKAVMAAAIKFKNAGA